MCKRRSSASSHEHVQHGETVRLTDLPMTHRNGHGIHFPWWVFWTIWPLMLLFKSASALFAPLMEVLNQPIMIQISLLPLLLIGAGVLIVLLDLSRRARRNQD